MGVAYGAGAFVLGEFLRGSLEFIQRGLPVCFVLAGGRASVLCGEGGGPELGGGFTLHRGCPFRVYHARPGGFYACVFAACRLV